jgi:predicted  nucleic acid-binding Zn-ribbon protein
MSNRYSRVPRSCSASSTLHFPSACTLHANHLSPISGAQERIAAMRQRHARLGASIEYYQSRLDEQTAQLSSMKRSRDYDDDDEELEPEPVVEVMTAEDLRREEEEVRMLESKKRGLEDRVHSMGRDISGLR